MIRKDYTGSYENIEQLANHILTEFRRIFPIEDSPHTTINSFLRNIVNLLRGKVEVTPALTVFEETGGSLLVRSDRSFKIFLSPTTTPIHDNFTIAHELGHYFLHIDFNSETESQSDVHFYRYGLDMSEGSDIRESQANRFAAAFLMPAEEFKKRYNELNGDIYKLCAHFQVPTPAVEVRIKRIINNT